ncbi:unnamed protein product [Microthlaspi erraticum]|uniref:Gnk2-homologous domain-containing protein n=1 Tax=Microthlaspi erraticum TaxID=1685480 RepID=A0A6D2IYQ7_9BRAS|nr:unnamed protein product [Microthlaspi erraticum]
MESQGKYKPGSKYEKDLKDIIGSLSSTSNFTQGLEMMSFGKGPSFVSVTAQCRGDSYGPKCRECFNTAQAELRRRCPRDKGGIIWYDQCLLVFSAINSLGKVDNENNFCMSNAKNFSVDHYSNREWMTLITNLTTIAIDDKKPKDAPKLYAAGERRFGRKTVYGMVQCMLDIESKVCQECITDEIVKFHDCLFYKQGARVLGRSCNIRYEFYPFIATKAGLKYLKT